MGGVCVYLCVPGSRDILIAVADGIINSRRQAYSRLRWLIRGDQGSGGESDSKRYLIGTDVGGGQVRSGFSTDVSQRQHLFFIRETVTENTVDGDQFDQDRPANKRTELSSSTTTFNRRINRTS